MKGELQPVQLHQDSVELLHKLGEAVKYTLEANNVYRNCCTCSSFLEVMEMCEKHNQRPPARIIAYGCGDHSHMIPF